MFELAFMQVELKDKFIMRFILLKKIGINYFNWCNVVIENELESFKVKLGRFWKSWTLIQKIVVKLCQYTEVEIHLKILFDN